MIATVASIIAFVTLFGCCPCICFSPFDPIETSASVHTIGARCRVLYLRRLRLVSYLRNRYGKNPVDNERGECTTRRRLPIGFRARDAIDELERVGHAIADEIRRRNGEAAATS